MINFHNSLLLLVQTKVLEFGYESDIPLHPDVIWNSIYDYFYRIGFVSDRFFNSSLLAVRQYFKNIELAVSSDQVSSIQNILNFFSTELHCIHLHQSSHEPLGATIDPASITSLSLYWPFFRSSEITLSQQKQDYFDFLVPSSPLFYPHITKLVINEQVSTPINLSSLANSLIVNKTLIRLELYNINLRDAAAELSRVFYRNTSLRSFRLLTIQIDVQGYALLCNAFIAHPSLRQLDFSCEPSWKSILPEVPFVKLLQSKSRIQDLKFSTLDSNGTSILHALQSNTYLPSITFSSTELSAEQLYDLLKFNKCLRYLEFLNCSFNPGLSLIFNALENNQTQQELVISHDFSKFRSSLTMDLIHDIALVKMLRFNKSLVFLSSPGVIFDSNSLKLLVKGLANNSTLKRVKLPDLSLEKLLTLFYALGLTKVKSQILVPPHFIDVANGIFTFEGRCNEQSSVIAMSRISRSDLELLQVYLEHRVQAISLKNCRFGDHNYHLSARDTPPP
ncbi:hypothetical protein GEMRC1_003147 [Eukaryota sp. GEM-RC1]